MFAALGLTVWMFVAPEGACALEVRGRVVDVATGEAVANATIRIEGEGKEVEAQTEDDGTYVVGSLCVGRYELRASRADYEADVRALRLDDSTAGFDVTLEPVEVDVLDDVVVVAPAPQDVDTRAADTLDGDALDAVRGRSLADSLAGISGVTVLRSPAGGMGKPIIRGQVGRRNLILYDGVRHEGQKWGIDHAPEIDPFAADSITVIKGAGGVRYGPDAIGGVVLVDPPPLPTEPGIFGETHLVGVSNGLRGTTATRLSGAHRKLPGFGWRLDYNATRGAALVSPDYVLDNTGTRIWNAGATLGYQRRGFGIEGSYRHHDMKAGLFTGLRNESTEEFIAGLELDRPVSAHLYEQQYAIDRAFQLVQHDLAMVRGRAPLGDVGDLVATYALQINDRDEFDTVREAVTGPQLEFDLRTHSGDLVFEQAAVPLGSRVELEGSTGASFAHKRNLFDGADPGFLPDYVEDGGGVFVIERLVLPRVELEAGGRYDGMRRISTLDDRAFLPARAQDRLPEDCEETDEGGRCTTSFHAGSGTVGTAVHPVDAAPGFVIEADASTAVRFPSTDEQFIKGSAPSFPVFANGDATLGRERTWTGGLAVTYANDWLYAQGAGYGSFIDDYIYFRAQPQSDDPASPNFSECAPLTCGIQGAFPLFAPTPVDALFYGGELSAKVRPPKWPVGFDAQGSWVRAQQVESGAPLVFIPPDRYRLGVTYYWPDFGPFEKGYVGAGVTIVDRQRRFDLEADFAPPPPAYALLTAEAGIEAPFDAQRLKVGVAGNNLTNARYRDYTSLSRYFANEPGWELSLRVSLDFDFGVADRGTGR